MAGTALFFSGSIGKVSPLGSQVSLCRSSGVHLFYKTSCSLNAALRLPTSPFLDRVTIVSVADHSKEAFHHTYTAAVLENLHRIARVLTPRRLAFLISILGVRNG